MCVCVCVFLAGGAQHNVLISFSGAMCDSPPKPHQRAVCSFDSSLVSVNTSILPNKNHASHGNLSSRQSPQPQPQPTTPCLAILGHIGWFLQAYPRMMFNALIYRLCGSKSVVKQIIEIMVMIRTRSIRNKGIPSAVVFLTPTKSECFDLRGSNSVVKQIRNGHDLDDDKKYSEYANSECHCLSDSYDTVFGNSVAQIRSFNK